MLLPSIVMPVISDAAAVLGRSVSAAATADPVIAMLRNSLRVFISSSLLSGVDSSLEKSSDVSVSSKLHGSAKPDHHLALGTASQELHQGRALRSDSQSPEASEMRNAVFARASLDL